MPDAACARPLQPDAQSRSFGTSLNEVGAIDDWIEGVGRQWGESERTMFRVRLCIAELAANVLEHGIPQAGDDRIAVTLRRAEGGIDVEFADTRTPFDPTGASLAARSETLGSAAPGGRGLMLIKAYTTEFRYRRDGDYNRMTLSIAR